MPASWAIKSSSDGHTYRNGVLNFDDPDGHLMEIVTRPYADTPEADSGR